MRRSQPMYRRSIVLVLLAATLAAAGWAGPASASVRASAAAQPVSLSLDNVPLVVQAPALPSEAFGISHAGDAAQVATWTAWQPFRELSITTVPFGHRAPTERLPAAASGGAGLYRRALHDFRIKQGGKVQDAATITLFGKQVTGARSLVSLPIEAGAAQPVVVDEWVAQSGNRLWIVRLSQEQEAGAAPIPLDFGSGLVIDSPAPDQPTSVGGSGSSGFRAQSPQLFAPAGAELPAAPWWTGDCDFTHYQSVSGTAPYRLGAVYLGVPACGPRPWYGGTDVLVRFDSTAWGQYEWECVELSMRFMFLKWGIRPYSANGKDVVNNYTGTLLVRVNNGTVGKPPMPNDVLSYGPTTQYGHTSVVSASSVDASGNGSITVIEQNASVSGSSTLTVSNWKVSAFQTISGWLHDPTGDPVYVPPSNTAVTMGGTAVGSYYLPAAGGVQQSYAGAANGPVRLYSLNGTAKMLASKRSVWSRGGASLSYSEMLGLPKAQLNSEYLFPWYSNTDPSLSQQLVITNVDRVYGNTVRVTVAGALVGLYTLDPGGSVTDSFAIEGGPLRVRSTTGKKLVVSLRSTWLSGGVPVSYSEMMGLPKGQLAPAYYLPWYNNSDPAQLDQQLAIANVDIYGTKVEVTAGGVVLENFTLPAGQSFLKSYFVDRGPLRVRSTSGRKLVVSLRAVWQSSSYSEWLGLPKPKAAANYYFPWYDNAAPGELSQQLLVSNVDLYPTTVEVSAGGVVLDSFPLAAGASLTKSYARDGAMLRVRTLNGKKIIASLRSQWQQAGAANSYSELIGLPGPLLAPEYWFPWYDDAAPAALDEQLQFGRP